MSSMNVELNSFVVARLDGFSVSFNGLFTTGRNSFRVRVMRRNHLNATWGSVLQLDVIDFN